MNYTKIKSIKKVETEPIYHLTVENNHNFFGNGMCLHNCDYYSNSKNDGNIIICLLNEGDKSVIINKGERIVQGIFKKYLIIDDDMPISYKREGGIGSTGK